MIAPRFVDVHSHVVPSGDDGAVSVEEGLELCRAAANAGTRVLFATPHMHGPLDSFPWTPEREQRYEEAFAAMQPTAERMGLDLRRGREVYPTEALHGALDALRLDGTSAVLVEFPGWWLDVDDAVGLTWAACERIDAEGLVPVLAHPERCPAVAADPASAVRFAARGWPLCLNGPSVLGDHGQTAERIAWWLLGEGTVSLVASDAHGAGRLPVLDVAREAIAQRLGADVADPLFDGRALQLGYDLPRSIHRHRSPRGRVGEGLRAREVRAVYCPEAEGIGCGSDRTQRRKWRNMADHEGNLTDVADSPAPAISGEARLSDRAIEGVRWIGAARAFAEVLALAGSIVLARVVPPAEFGRAAAALGVVVMFPSFVSQAFGAPIIQAAAATRELVRTAVGLSIVAGTLLTGLVLLIAWAVIDPVLGSRTAYLAALAAPAVAAASIGSVARALLQRQLVFRTLGLIEIGALVVSTGTAVVLATLVGLDGEAIVLAFVAGSVASALLSLLYAPSIRPGWGGRSAAGAILSFGLPAGGSALLATSFRSVDYLVLAGRMRPADVGFYWRAFALGVEYQTKISVIMQRVAYPVFARTPSRDELRRLRLRVMATHAAIIFPLLATLVAVAPVLVPWLFGERWEPAVLPTQILSGGGMAAALIAGSPSFVLALGRPKALLAYNIVSVAGLALTAYVSAPLGLVGVAACIAAFFVVLLLVNHLWLLHGIGGIAIRDLWSETVPPLVACVPLAASGFALVELFDRADAHAFVTLVATIPLGFVVYGLVLRLAFPGSWTMLRAVFERVFGLRRTSA